jgi:hypothetical protein
MLKKDINNFIPLPYNFKVKNSLQLMPDLMDIQYKNDLKFASFHITNMYTNIPTQKLRDVTKYLHIHNNVD